jgi:hypothetical protein
MCERGARNQNVISGLAYTVAGIDNLFFSMGRCLMGIRTRAKHYRDVSVVASRQLASQPKLKTTLCERKGRRIH